MWQMWLLVALVEAVVFGRLGACSVVGLAAEGGGDEAKGRMDDRGENKRASGLVAEEEEEAPKAAASQRMSMLFWGGGCGW